MKEPKTRELENGRFEVDLRIWGGPRTSRGTAKEAKDLIDEYRGEIKKKGEWWANLRPAQQDQIRTTVMAMNEAGYEIDTVGADHQRWRAENDSAVTTPKPYGEVVTSHYDEQLKSGTSERYTQEIKGVFTRFSCSGASI